ncbi:hypothetical protein Fcan01_21653 [Folsomia candida]|uniref:Uncharacterized protein n=1 Tax=Folsomia candida TaxID=158441 RepID=A0A226DEH5_FOLCA|nr:hypothetical protein Fcan01_21653 [Folsomia candida]
MCKHKLRNMLKPRTLKMIAFWETGFWPVMCGWIVIMFTKRESEDEFALDSEEHQLIIHQHNEDWEKGLWFHSITCFLYAPIAGLLFLGVKNRSRFCVVLWMIFYILTSIIRIWALVTFQHAYIWLRWFEFYWILRIYFLLCAFHYCLDLWAEHATAEHLDPPLLLPTDDPRSWRGAHNYPEHPLTLDQRATVFGTGRHTPMHLDWRFVVHPFPTWYESQDEHGNSMLVVDNSAYNPDTR